MLSTGTTYAMEPPPAPRVSQKDRSFCFIKPRSVYFQINQDIVLVETGPHRNFPHFLSSPVSMVGSRKHPSISDALKNQPLKVKSGPELLPLNALKLPFLGQTWDVGIVGAGFSSRLCISCQPPDSCCVTNSHQHQGLQQQHVFLLMGLQVSW